MFRCGIISLLLLVVYTMRIARAADIVQPPTDITGFLDNTAVFKCEVDGGLAGWRVNGTYYNDLSPEIRSDLDADQEDGAGGNEILTLTIPGKTKYNETRVQCVVFGGASKESENATMTVQGTPSSVTDLETSGNSTSVTISWTAPFSLDVTDVDPDIWYSVLIYNVTDEPTAIPCTDCINITETHYTFTPDYPSPCQEYIFSVIPLNGAGQGETSHNVSGYTIDDVDRDLNVQVLTKAIDSSFFQVIFNISGAVCSYSLTGVDENSITDTQLLDNEEDGIDIIYTLPANINDAFFEVSNATSSWTISFTTFDVQDITVTTSGSEIFVTGVFAADSAAKGLFVVLTSEDDSPDEFRAVLREGQGDSGITVPPSTYTLLVYDLEENALPNENTAFVSSEKIYLKNEYQNTNPTTEFIKGANIFISGSTVEITCELSEEYPESSCVLVYREYGNPTLVVEEYTRNNKPPDSIVLDNPKSIYSFAIFGKNGSAGIDPKPVTTERYIYMYVATTATITEEPTVTGPHPSDEQSSQRGPVVEVAVGVPVAMIAVMFLLIVLIILLIMLMRKKRVKGKLTIPKYPSSPIIHNPTKIEDALEYQNEDNRSSAWTITLPDGPPEEEESKYASVMVAFATTSLPIVGPPVRYIEVDLKATKRQAHPRGLLYAELGAPSPYSKRPTKPPSTKSTTQYVDVLPHSIPTDNTASDTKETDKKTKEKPVEKSVPVTVEAVMSLLLAVAGLWKAIAEGLGFDEDRIDEIYTNDDTDEACLQNCVEQWVSKLDPTWQKLSHVLSDMGQESLAQQALQNGGHNSMSQNEDETSFMTPSVVSAGSGYDGTSQVANGNYVQPQTTHNEDETSGSKTAVENNAEPSDNVDVTRACFTPKKESPTNPISVHNIPSQYTADPDMTADDSTADDSTVDGMPQCVPPTMECCDDSSNNDSLPVYGGCAYPTLLNPVSGNNAVSLGNGIQLNNTEMVPDQQETDHCHFVLSHEPVSPSILNYKCDMDSTRKVHSQVVPQVCSELPTTVRSFKRPMGTPAICEPQCDAVDKTSAFGVEQLAEPYKCNVGDEMRCYYSSEQLIAPFLVPRQFGMVGPVIGTSLTKPCPGGERCDVTDTTADETSLEPAPSIPQQPADSTLPPEPAPSMPQQPINNTLPPEPAPSMPQQPADGSLPPEPAPSMPQQPADNTLPPEPTLEENQSTKNSPPLSQHNGHDYLIKQLPFSDPENYHQKMKKWTYNGANQGFRGPGFMRSFGSSHYV